MKNALPCIILCITAAISASSCSKTERTYYPDGKIQSSIQYRFGKENGKTIYYYNTPNTVEIEIEMKNGKRNGEFHRYFENGMLDTYCRYENDSIEGLQTIYTPNGEKSLEYTFVHGKKEGPFKAYHLSGDIKTEGYYKNDLFDSTWTYYDERGIVVGEGTFQNGSGTVSFYNANGHLDRTTSYVKNLKDGPEKYYDNAGNLYKEIIFKQDRIVEQRDSLLF